jgi:hypothetical protein
MASHKNESCNENTKMMIKNLRMRNTEQLVEPLFYWLAISRVQREPVI